MKSHRFNGYNMNRIIINELMILYISILILMPMEIKLIELILFTYLILILI